MHEAYRRSFLDISMPWSVFSHGSHIPGASMQLSINLFYCVVHIINVVSMVTVRCNLCHRGSSRWLVLAYVRIRIYTWSGCIGHAISMSLSPCYSHVSVLLNNQFGCDSVCQGCPIRPELCVTLSSVTSEALSQLLTGPAMPMAGTPTTRLPMGSSGLMLLWLPRNNSLFPYIEENP